jgi:hypothetical protein
VLGDETSGTSYDVFMMQRLGHLVNEIREPVLVHEQIIPQIGNRGARFIDWVLDNEVEHHTSGRIPTLLSQQRKVNRAY